MTNAAAKDIHRSRHLRTTSSTAFVVAVVSVAALFASLLNSSATEAAGPSPKTAEGRLVARAGFELGLGGWRKTRDRMRLDRAASGQAGSRHSARMRAPKSSRANVGMTDSPSLIRRTVRGQVYRARVWVKATPRAVRHSRVSARVQLRESNNGHRVVQTWRRVGLTNTRWHRVTVWLTARGDLHGLGVTVDALDVPRGAGVLVDNVRLHKVSPARVAGSVLKGTKFGASVDEGGKDWTRALHNSDRRYGRMDVVRMYDPDVPASWSGRLGEAKRPIVYSIGARPAAILSGRHDGEIRRWFNAAPSRWPIWWSYIHEPEDNIEHGEFGALRYRQAWRHINRIAQHAHNRQLRPTLILMCWSLSPSSGRHFNDYYPGNFIKVLAWDCYNSADRRTRYKTPRDIFYRVVAKTHAMGKGFGVAEFGSRIVPGDDGSRRAMWLASMARYLGRHHAAFAAYWDAKIPAGDFRLRDLPSRRSWRRVVSAH